MDKTLLFKTLAQPVPVARELRAFLKLALRPQE